MQIMMEITEYVHLIQKEPKTCHEAFRLTRLVTAFGHHQPLRD